MNNEAMKLAFETAKEKALERCRVYGQPASLIEVIKTMNGHEYSLEEKHAI